jgi:hypothetical protein
MADKLAAGGADFTRADAFGKVTGRELYAIDFYPDNMLWQARNAPGSLTG